MFQKLTRRIPWEPDRGQFLAPLHFAPSCELQLHLFPKGVDNARIDVALSPEFTGRAKVFARRSLLHDISENYWGRRVPAPGISEIRSVQESYTGMMEVAVDRSRKRAGSEQIQLLQLAAIKFMLYLVDAELDRLHTQIRQSRDLNNTQSEGRSVELHERLVVLAKEEPVIRHRLTRRMFGILLKLEDVHLSKLRQSVVGDAWPLSKEILSNPMLRLPSLRADEQLMQYYTLAFNDPDDRKLFDQVNRLVVGLFEKYVPDCVKPVSEQAARKAFSRHDTSVAVMKKQRKQGVLPGLVEVEQLLEGSLQPQEYEQNVSCWLDYPANMEQVLFSPHAHARKEPSAAHPAFDHWPEYRQRLLQKLFRELERKGLEGRILAFHAAPSVYRELAGRVPVRLICQYLGGAIHRRDLQRRLSGTQPPGELSRLIKVLHTKLQGIKRTEVRVKRKIVLRFLIDFTLFRRDLKLAYGVYKAFNGIRLLTSIRDIELSHRNGTLQEFVLRQELIPRKHEIRNHVVIKADLRGSTRITQKLLDKSLNPDYHFSLNFFRPINKLLANYGARKVFVEGDAVILSVLEYEGIPFQWLCVSHACGLSREILRVVDAQNVQNRKNDLPELEVGLGIAFSDQAPAFLYDEDKEIMISPAINLADRLSSCSPLLRRPGIGNRKKQDVEVVVSKSGMTGGYLRYNVNGIELDAAAFEKLRSEINLTVLDCDGLTGLPEGRYHAGRYPDLEGGIQWLLIREAPVRVWDQEKGDVGRQCGDSFYQVVTDSVLIDRLTGTQKDYRQPRSSVQGEPLFRDNTQAIKRHVTS